MSENLSWHIKIALDTSSSPLCEDGVVRLERDRMLIRRSARYGYKLDQVSANYQRFDSTFNRRVFSVVDVPVVQDILIGRWTAKWSQALGMASERRSVYLMATRLDRFASISEGTGAATSIISGLWMQTLHSPFRMDSINYWALLIMGNDGLEEASLLCQLRVSTGGYIEYGVMEDYTLAQTIMEKGRHIGFTMCSNDAIKEQGERNLHLHSLATIVQLINSFQHAKFSTAWGIPTTLRTITVRHFATACLSAFGKQPQRPTCSPVAGNFLEKYRLLLRSDELSS